MKTRNGFVSNSSTSSFICDVCGREEMGMDLSLSDCDMYNCVKGHIFCQEEAVKTNGDINDDEEADGSYDIPSKYCPVCQMEIFTEEDLADYLKRTTDITNEDALAKIKGSNPNRGGVSSAEYVMYVLTRLNKTAEEVIGEIKSRFKSYNEFSDFNKNKEQK